MGETMKVVRGWAREKELDDFVEVLIAPEKWGGFRRPVLIMQLTEAGEISTEIAEQIVKQLRVAMPLARVEFPVMVDAVLRALTQDPTQ